MSERRQPVRGRRVRPVRVRARMMRVVLGRAGCMGG